MVVVVAAVSIFGASFRTEARTRAPGAPVIPEEPTREATAVAGAVTSSAGRAQSRTRRYHGNVSQLEPSVDESVELPAEEATWLEERLQEYRELLEYLHDH